MKKQSIIMYVSSILMLSASSQLIAAAQGTGALSPCKITKVAVNLVKDKGFLGLNGVTYSTPYPTRVGQKFQFTIKYKCRYKVSAPIAFSMTQPDGKVFYSSLPNLNKGNRKYHRRKSQFRAKIGVYKFRFKTKYTKSGGMNVSVRLTGKRLKCPVRMHFNPGSSMRAQGTDALKPCRITGVNVYRFTRKTPVTEENQRFSFRVKYYCKYTVPAPVIFTMEQRPRGKSKGRIYYKSLSKLSKGAHVVTKSSPTFHAKPGNLIFKFKTKYTKSGGMSRFSYMNVSSTRCPIVINGHIARYN